LRQQEPGRYPRDRQPKLLEQKLNVMQDMRGCGYPPAHVHVYAWRPRNRIIAYQPLIQEKFMKKLIFAMVALAMCSVCLIGCRVEGEVDPDRRAAAPMHVALAAL
jgi:hypothetical protein